MGLSAWLNWEGAAIFQDFFLSKFCRFPRGLRDGKLQSCLGSSQVFQPCQRKSSMKDKPLIKLLLFSSIHTELFFFFSEEPHFFFYFYFWFRALAFPICWTGKAVPLVAWGFFWSHFWHQHSWQQHFKCPSGLICCQTTLFLQSQPRSLEITAE